MKRPPCVHCGIRLGCRPRNLCVRCYDNRTIRHQYAVRGISGEHNRRDETMADLDRLIAERMDNLPRWFHKDTPPVPQGPRVGKVAREVVCTKARMRCRGGRAF